MSSASDSANDDRKTLSDDRARLLHTLRERKWREKKRIVPYARDSGRGELQLPASWAQERLWFIDQLYGQSIAYHIPLAVRLLGILDVPALQKALDALVERHDVLRTSFAKVDGNPRQEISFDAHFPLSIVDLSGHGKAEVAGYTRTQKIEEMREKFDLRRGPLIRGRLAHISSEEHLLLITMHHIVSDGWSNAVLIRELGLLYSAYCEGRDNPLDPLPIQYADYARWQREWLQGEALEKQLAYWRSHLEGAAPQLELPTDRTRPALQSYRGDNVGIVLDAELTARIRVLAQRYEVTLSMILYAGWALLLSRLSGQDDVLLGVPVANRRVQELESLVGFFVNTLVLRFRINGNLHVDEFLRHVKEVALGAYDHQDVPFEKLVETLQPQRDLSRNPLFQVMLAFQNTQKNELCMSGLAVVLEGVEDETSKFDLLLSLEDRGAVISGNLNYASDLFNRTTIQRWIACFAVLLESMCDDSKRHKVDQLPILPNRERDQIVTEFNRTRAVYSTPKLVHELFEEQVQHTPAAVAVICEEHTLTYAELNRRANQLARHLRTKGIGPDQLVGICAERSVEMVVALFGTLKAGGAYVPLDPSYPSERLSYMLRDAAPRVLLIQERLRPLLAGFSTEMIALDQEWSEIAQYPSANLDASTVSLTDRHLAYVIYTSGSTGKPKGAMNEHKAVANRLQWMQEKYVLGSDDRLLQKTPFSFDVSVWEFFWPLMAGARLVVARPEGHKDPNYLRAIIEEAGITTLHFVPSMLQSFLDQYRPGGCPSLRHVVCSGEELSAALQLKFFNALPTAHLSNLYGPTEAAVDVTAWDCLPNDRSSRIPIGRPIANIQIYILDQHGQPVPIGVAGEIHIGGVGVGRGYLKRRELSAERFLPDPFRTDANERMYKTGDLGRWRDDGAIEYLGRNDYQVKIRGFRIELGEIEACLLRHEQVKETIVLVREDVPGDKRLVAYLTLNDSVGTMEPPNADILRMHLRTQLPEHMVPSAFVVLEKFPVTPNGKLDRRALPAPELEAYTNRQYEPPQGEAENLLARIWEDLLHLEHVGRNDNFFELGGHSLLIVQMMDRLHNVGLFTEVRRVFETPTLMDLAAVLTGVDVELFDVPANQIPPQCQSITPEMLPLVTLDRAHIERIAQAVPGGMVNIQDIYSLAPLQEGILFHHLLAEQSGDMYVLPTVLLASSRQHLENLIRALQAVIDRHDVLRTAVLWEHLPRPVQVVYRQAPLPIQEVKLDPKCNPAEQIKQWVAPDQQRMDLRSAPLMHLTIAADPHSENWYVLLQLHHIVDDATSQLIMFSEVTSYLSGRQDILPDPTPYRNHVAQALAHANRHDAVTFFRAKLGGVDMTTAPFGLLNVHGDRSRGAQEDVEPALAQRIRVHARRLGVSVASIFHAAWGLVVAHTSSRDDVVYGTVLLGRLHGSAGAQRTLGMFINTLPLRLRLQAITAKELIEQTQRELAELVNHEQASLSDAQRCSGIHGTTPLFTALLNYRHTTRTVQDEFTVETGLRVLAMEGWTHYPMALSVDDLGRDFKLSADTDRAIDPERVLNYTHTALHSLIQALESDPQSPVLRLSILTAAERHTLLELFNDTEFGYPQQRAVHELFEEQARRTPEKVAVLHDGHALTYEQLDQQSNQLARYLRKRGAGPEQLVGICVERSLEMVIGLLGIMKAGSAYLPLDPSYPVERLGYMLQDAAPRVVLTLRRLKVTLPETQAELIELDTKRKEIAGYSDKGLSTSELRLTPRNLVYVIYTSGSTGQPKGTAMPHRSMVNLIEWHRRSFPNNEGRRVLQFAALSFDVAFQEIFTTLCTGGALVLVDEWVRRDSRALLELLINRQVERLFVPPLMLQSLAESFKIGALLPSSLQDVITAGEALHISTEVSMLFRELKGCRLHNHYGPTETHVVTALTLSGDVADWPPVPTIGRPISNSRIYVLDEQRQPAPIGVVGEIYIGGAGVARGYLRRPELTEKRFVADQFSAELDARLYKSGDLGRWRADGTLEYLGRNDEQVKVRGYRVELGEIEAQLVRHEQVQEAVVVALDDGTGQKRLVAYLIGRDGIAPNVEYLRAHLRAALPEYMVPSALMILERFPLTPSGKMDRRAMPVPELQAFASRPYKPPQGEIEPVLGNIWQKLLHVERVGRDDSFFELGGHSLLALRLLFEITESFGADLTVVDVYRTPTLSELATRVSRGAVADEKINLAEQIELIEIPAVNVVPSANSRNTLSSDDSILLTGATGFVGRFLLAQLIQDTAATIYCLVRAQSQSEAASRLKISLSKWDLWEEKCTNRVIAIAGDLRLPHLGIDDVSYETLSNSVSSIYHCGSSVNHLETYEMAKAANVLSTKEILHFAAHGKLKLVNYISTLGVFRRANETALLADERSEIDHETHRSSGGYLASKWVSEKCVLLASKRGLPCNIFRIGLVWADTQKGRYDELQRGHRFLKSCIISGCAIRDYRFEMPPTPVDYVARAVVYLANRYPDGNGIFHISSVDGLLGGVFERCNSVAGLTLNLMSSYDWTHEMIRLHRSGKSLPIVPLIEAISSMDESSFYRYQKAVGSMASHVNCDRTQAELVRAGIVAPPFTDELIRVTLNGMFSTDWDLLQEGGVGSPSYGLRTR